MTEMNEMDQVSTEIMYKIDSEEKFYETGEDEPEKPEKEEIKEMYREYELEELVKDEFRKIFSEDEIDIEDIHKECDLRRIRKNYTEDNYEEDGSKQMGKNYLREISNEDELEQLDTDYLEEINYEDDHEQMENEYLKKLSKENYLKQTSRDNLEDINEDYLEQLSEDSFEETDIVDDLELDTENLEESTKEDKTLKLAKIDFVKINNCKLVKIKHVLEQLKGNPEVLKANRVFLDKLSNNSSTSDAAVSMQGDRKKEQVKTECAQEKKRILHNRKKVRSSDKISKQYIKNTLYNALSGEITKLKNISRDLFEMKEDTESRNLLGKLSYLERSLQQSRESLEYTPLQQVAKPLCFNKCIESLFEARRKIQHYEQMLGRNVLARLMTDFSEVAKILEQPK